MIKEEKKVISEVRFVFSIPIEQELAIDLIKEGAEKIREPYIGRGFKFSIVMNGDIDDIEHVEVFPVWKLVDGEEK